MKTENIKKNLGMASTDSVVPTDSIVTATGTSPQETTTLWKKVIITVLLSAIVIFTVASNLIVLTAFAVEKSCATHSHF